MSSLGNTNPLREASLRETTARSGEAAPHAYIIHKKRQLCTTCSSLHEWSEIYAKTSLRSNWGHKSVTNLRPIRSRNDVLYNLPIEVITFEPQTVLFCHVCHDTESDHGGILRHLPPPPAKPLTSPPSWVGQGHGETPTELGRKAALGGARPPGLRPKDTKAATIDDL